MATPSRYRVEHRQPRRSTVLGILDGATPRRHALDPYVSRLTHDGETGSAVLIDDATGAVVTRRSIDRTGRP